MDSSLSPTDLRFLQQTIELGKRGWGKVAPNPLVGCLLVKDGQVLSEGWHEEYGGAHAEVHALEAAKGDARGATAYVSLEPCNHTGQTPPCSEALIQAGISRVVFGASDPGQESGGGGGTLREAGIEVVGPCLSLEEARRENPAFFWNQERGSTFVAVKLAQTLDGKIAEAQGRRTSITGPEAREETHRLRAGFDGVMVGSNTVLVDDPFLTVRHGVHPRSQPWRVVLDTEGRTPSDANLFKDLPAASVLIFAAEDASGADLRRLERAGAQVHRIRRSSRGLSIPGVLEACWSLGIRSLLCEGGGILATGLVKHDWAQRLYLFLAPFVLGEEGVPAFPDLRDREVWREWKPTGPGGLFGRDVLLTFDRIEGCSQGS